MTPWRDAILEGPRGGGFGPRSGGVLVEWERRRCSDDDVVASSVDWSIVDDVDTRCVLDDLDHPDHLDDLDDLDHPDHPDHLDDRGADR